PHPVPTRRSSDLSTAGRKRSRSYSVTAASSTRSTRPTKRPRWPGLPATVLAVRKKAALRQSRGFHVTPYLTCHTRLRTDTRLHPLLPQLSGADPAGGPVREDHRADLGPVRRHHHLGACAGRAETQLRHRLRRRRAERHHRYPAGLGAGALPFSGP